MAVIDVNPAARPGHLVEAHSTFQPRIFFAHLLQLPDLIDLQTTVLFLPSVERLFRYSYLPDQLHNRYTQLCLLQNGHNLLYSESLLLHGKTLPLQV